VLSLNQSFPEFSDKTTLSEIFEFYKNLGVDYDKLHTEYRIHEREVHERLVNWQVEDFEGIIVDGQKYYKWEEGNKALVVEEEVDIDKLVREDTVVLQNYGRPYNNGKPTGNYYKFAKTELLTNFPIKPSLL